MSCFGKLIVALAIGGSFLTHNGYAQRIEPVSSYQLQIQSEVIELDSPFLLKDRVYFFPIRDVVRPLDATFEYLRREEAYHFRLQDEHISSLIVPNLRQLIVNGERHYLSVAPFFYENRLYVPVSDFFTALGYEVTLNDKTFIVRRSHKEPVKEEAPPKSPGGGVIYATTDKAGTLLSDAIQIPYLDKDRPFALRLGGYRFDRSRSFFYKDDVLMVRLDDAFSNTSFRFVPTDSGVTVTFHDVKAVFYYDKSQAIVTEDGASSPVSLENAPVRKNGVIYYPLKSFMQVFGWAGVWDARNRELRFLTRIKAVQLVQEDGVYKCQVLSTYPIKPSKKTSVFWGRGFQVEIPDSLPDVSHTTLESDHDSIRSVEVIRGADSTFIKFNLEKEIAYSDMLSKPFGAELAFETVIQEMVQGKTRDGYSVLIRASGDFAYDWAVFDQPDRLVVDLKGGRSQLPPVLSSDIPFVKSIRTSQFKVRPPISRVVFDLAEPIASPKIQYRDGHLAITFSSPGTDVPPVVAKSAQNANQATVSKPPASSLPVASVPVIEAIGKAKELSKEAVREEIYEQPKTAVHTRLKGKTIVIDPGHGGSDPGAIGLKGDYEKIFTLDISKRLKKLFEEEGARVVMCREGDQNPSLSDRVEVAKRERADILLSVHVNSFFKPYAKGTETYYYKYEDKALAEAIHRQMVGALKQRDNGVKRARLYVLRHTNMPAALVEPLFLTNPKEYEMVTQPFYRQKIAEAIYRGTLAYYGKL